MNKSKYEDYEDQITALLHYGSFDIKPLPDNEMEFSRAFTKPQIYVCYVGSDFGADENIGVVAQEETVNIDLLFRVNKRRGENGLLSVANYAALKLLGIKLIGAQSKIKLIKQGYIDSNSNQNNWQYVVSLSFTTHIVECINEEPTASFDVIEFTGSSNAQVTR